MPEFKVHLWPLLYSRIKADGTLKKKEMSFQNGLVTSTQGCVWMISLKLSNLWWMPNTFCEGSGTATRTSQFVKIIPKIPQNLSLREFQVSFPLLWIKINLDKPQATVKGSRNHRHLTVYCCQNCNEDLVLTAMPIPLLTEFSNYHRLESCAQTWFDDSVSKANALVTFCLTW